jgi:hypothetical protein
MTVIGSESLNMTFLKSFLAGLAASFVAVIVFPIAYGFAMILFSPRSPGRDVAVSWDLRSALASQGLLWCYVLTVTISFGIGFWLVFSPRLALTACRCDFARRHILSEKWTSTLTGVLNYSRARGIRQPTND